MLTTRTTITIKDLIQGYVRIEDIDDDNEILGYDGKLIIRPAYQREFIYDDEKQKKVIESVINGFPLNTIFLVKINDEKYELLDGQQRILSICQFMLDVRSFNLEGIFNSSKMNATNLKSIFPEIYEKIMNYELDVCICEGNNEEKLKWFNVINTAGEKLNDQELRNAVYTGKWLNEAKKYFGKSKNGCLALIKPMINNCKIIDYNDEKASRQLVLELALEWKTKFDNLTDKNIDSIESYMNFHRNDENANDLIDFWNKLVKWVLDIFGYNKSNYLYANELKEVNKNWGEIYNNCFNNNYNYLDIQKEVHKLMADDEIMKKNGIFGYVLTKDEKYLNFRQFDKVMKKKKYNEQNGICPGVKTRNCNQNFTFDEMQGDHIIPWSKGGKTEYDNLQMLCKKCNRIKSNN